MNIAIGGHISNAQHFSYVPIVYLRFATKLHLLHCPVDQEAYIHEQIKDPVMF